MSTSDLAFLELNPNLLGRNAYRVSKRQHGANVRVETLELYRVEFKSHLYHFNYMTLGNLHKLHLKELYFLICRLTI